MIPKVNVKAITQHAYDTIRYLNANDVRAEKSYHKFLVAGEKAPGYAKLKLIEAINDPKTFVKPEQRLKTKDNSGNWSISTKLLALTKKFPFEQMLFDSSYKGLYPYTIYNRKAIESYFESFCFDSSKLKTSRMKWYKTVLAGWNKLVD